nr:ABC transporter substrate-binding protein [uncultured Dysosmobacter sp.]
MKKKLFALILAGLMTLSLAACGGSQSDSEDGAPADSGDGQSYVVGICQLAPHPALDAATQGFTDALKEALGDQVQIKNQNAGGEVPNCTTIIDGFVAENVDLILANATPALTAAASATSEIPILGTAVTNYGVALDLDTTEDKVLGGNIAGTSDLAPLDQQAAMLQELFPEAKNVGLLYCSAEANSMFQVETIQGYLEDMGYTCTQYAFTDVNDLSSVAQNAADNSDVIYIPTDNTAANNAETIANVVVPAKVPVVAGEEGICKGCGCVTLSIDYYELGQITGQQAVEILTGAKSVSETAIGFDTTLEKKFNAANCEALGITVPEDYVAIEG